MTISKLLIFLPAFVLALLLSKAAHGQSTPPISTHSEQAIQLSLPQAISLARQHSAEVRLAQRRVAEAEATRVGAGVVMPVNPRLSLEARPSIPNSNYPVQQMGYGAVLDVLFEVGGAPSARLREAGLRTRSAQAEAELAAFVMGLQAWKIYLAATIAQQRIIDTSRALIVAQRVMAAAMERIAAGAAGDTDMETARLEVAQLDTSLRGAERERDVQLMALRDILDQPASQTLELTTQPEVPPTAPPLETLLALALQQRPELAVLRTRSQLLEATADRLEREVTPRVGFFTGIDASPYSAMFWGFGASIELPVAQRNRGPLAVARSEKETIDVQLDLIKRRIEREVISDREAYASRLRELAMLTDHAIPAAERNLLLIETGWRSGRFDVFRVTAAARDLIRAKGLRLDALEAAWLDRIALEQAAGGWPK